MSAVAPSPTETPTTPQRRSLEPLYGWIFLAGLAVIVAFLDPILIDLQPRPEASLALAALGIALLGAGFWRHAPVARVAGACLLWLEVIAGIGTQISPLSAPAAVVWAPRAALLAVAALGWIMLLEAPAWLVRGVLAVAAPTFIILAVVWQTAPPIALNARLYWIAVDSQSTLYAADGDNGTIWVFDEGGAVRGKLWPRHASEPGVRGPGIEPAGVGSTFLAPVRTPVPGMPTDREFPFCGLAVDSADHLYVIDVLLRTMLQFDRDGQLLQRWKLPDTLGLSGNCVAALGDRLYIADSSGGVQIFDQHGADLGRWPTKEAPNGVAVAANNQILTLLNRRVTVYNPATGQVAREIALPPASPLESPYQSALGRANGEILVSDVLNISVLRFAPNGAQLAPLGGAGQMPGQFASPGALAEDPQGRVYVSDGLHHVVQRFTADGRVDAIFSTAEDEQEPPR
jgi:hypothetical protein